MNQTVDEQAFGTALSLTNAMPGSRAGDVRDLMTKNLAKRGPRASGPLRDHERAGRPRSAYDYVAHGPNGGMSLLGLSGKAGARFSKNDFMPSWASAPAAR